MAQVIWTDSALNDLAKVFDYLTERMQSVDRAEEFCVNLFQASVERLQRLPDSGALVEELAGWQAREIYWNSYRIIYVRKGDACYVNMRIHGSRDLARHIDRDLWDQLP